MPDSNPRTVEEARAFVSRVESLFMPWDIDGLLAGFADDALSAAGTSRSSATRRRSKGCFARAASGRGIIGCAKSFVR
jgi:hypothetical protein